MKIRRNFVKVGLLGSLLAVTSPVLGVTKSRVPEKTAYAGERFLMSEEWYNTTHFCSTGGGCDWCVKSIIGAEDILHCEEIANTDKLGGSPSYKRNLAEMEVGYFLENHMPFTLPVGQIQLSSIMGTKLEKDVELNIKLGVNRYKVEVDGKQVETPAIKGIALKQKFGNYTDLKKNHWAYSSLVKAVENGWILPDSPTIFGMETYENWRSPVNGLVTKERRDYITSEEMFRGINGVLMSNGVYLGNNFSRTDLRKYFKGYTAEDNEYIDKVFDLGVNGGKYAELLNLCLSACGVIGRSGDNPLDYYPHIFDIAEAIPCDITSRESIATFMHNIVHDMNLPVVNNMDGNEYSNYDYTIKNNRIQSVYTDTGDFFYIVSRGIINPEKVNGKYHFFNSGVVGKPEFATILCNFDRAIKAAKIAR